MRQGLGVKVRDHKGAWWLFIDHNGRRKAKRVGPGREGERAAHQAAEIIQARLALGDYTFDEANEPKPVTFREYADV